MSNKSARLCLRKQEDRRVLAGHLWVYSNEVDTKATPLTGFKPGDAVTVVAQNGRPLGSGYVNPHSLICARLMTSKAWVEPGADLLRMRLQQALVLREKIYPQPYYRLVFGEGDMLPGLVVDRFGDTLVVQITTAGMECLRDDVVKLLLELLQPEAILLRNDTSARKLEGLSQESEVIHGTLPEQLVVEENGMRFHAPAEVGQKTGWFYDHRDNRAAMLAQVAPGARVLDICSYLGAWGLQALGMGAESLTAIDSSQTALEGLGANAELNSLEQSITALHGDAFDALRELREAGEKFDLVIADPPAFIKRRKDLKEGQQAYRRLNKLALQCLAPGGTLISASCSYHLQREQLSGAILQAGRQLDLVPQLLASGGLGRDHPVHPAIPETNYLKAFMVRALPA
jgi:23S rRNA (cytosine1962-C5)-methyltransferase